MNTALTVSILSAGYASLFLLERLFPLRRTKERLLPRLLVNVAVSATAFAAAALVVQPAATSMLGLAERQSLGLLPLFGLARGFDVIAAFLLLDLSFYYWHVANHRVAFLWRFHNVHHIDPDLDVSTAFRFHFVEVAFSAGFRVVQILVVGPSLLTYAIYQVVFELGTLFHHSNVRVPIHLERLLNLILVTPRMHGIHHSDIRDEDLTNFGVVFSWWDRLHRTLRLNVPQSEVTIGIPGYSEPADNTVLHSLVLPFQAQRDYWQGPHGERLRRKAVLPSANRLTA